MTTHWQDRFSEWLSNLFRFNREELKPDLKIAELIEKGFHHNE